MEEQDRAGMQAPPITPGTDVGAQATEATTDPLAYLRAARLAVIDTETTGFRVEQGARAIEFAVVRLWNLEPVAQVATLIDCVDEVPEGAQKVHGITREMIRGGFDLSNAWSVLVSAIGGVDALVFHNASFDLPFISWIVSAQLTTHDEAQKANFRDLWLNKPVIDTLGLARALRGPRGNSLTDLAAALAVPQDTAHRALGDALTTARVLPVLASQFAARFGSQTIASLAAASEESMRRTESAFGRTVSFRRSAGLE